MRYSDFGHQENKHRTIGSSVYAEPWRWETEKKMKYIGMVLFASLCVSCASTAPKPPPIPSEYVCTNRFFAVPESFDPSNLEQAHMLVKANPDRFEAHLTLASALVANNRIEDAIREFKMVDELASQVEDQAVLAGLQYEDLYAFALFVAAERRFKKNVNDLYTLRMLQQVIGMDLSKLKEKGLLPRCYVYTSTLYIKRGSYESAIRAAEAGQRIAKECGDSDSVGLLQQIVTKAREMKTSQPDKSSVRGKPRR